jgi:hypothetical protein
MKLTIEEFNALYEYGTTFQLAGNSVMISKESFDNIKDTIETQQQEIQQLQAQNAAMPEKVCLCGSTRFFRAFDDWNYRFTLKGKIVLSIGCNTKSDKGLGLTSEDKSRLDELHKRKIDLADWVFVLDVDRYIGDSTRSEIDYAMAHGKLVRFLSLECVDYKEPQGNYHNPADVEALRLVKEELECIVSGCWIPGPGARAKKALVAIEKAGGENE